jgi:hypothetical protein
MMSDKFIFSPCFGKCTSTQKFITGINHVRKNIPLHSFIKDINNFIIVNHGTPVVENAFKICCQSLSVLHRKRQYCGSGEYFSSGLKTAKDYAGYNGAIVRTLLINPSICINDIKVVVGGDHEEDWYVVNNTQSMSFALPFGIYESGPSIKNIGSMYCVGKKTQDVFNKVTNGGNIIISFYGDNGFQQYDSDVHEIIKHEFISNKKSCEIKINNNIYVIDFILMTQTNKKSNFIRNISIEVI